MKVLFFLSLLSLCLAGCSSDQDDKDEIDIEHMVMNEEETPWTTGAESDQKEIASDMIPFPQESIISDTLEAPTKVDPVDACR